MRLAQKGFWVVTVCLIPLSLFADPSPFFNFKQLVRMLKIGQNVSAIVYYNRCNLQTPETEEASPRNNTVLNERFNLNEFSYKRISIKNEMRYVVVTSREMLISLQDKGWFRRYIRLRIFDDSTAEIYSTLFSMKTAAQYGNPKIWHCQIGQSQGKSGLYLQPSTYVTPPPFL